MEKTKQKGFTLNPETGYFSDGGVDVIAYEDIYPAGHQGGISVIMNGERIAANGDLRFEPTPGQWQPVSKQKARRVIPEEGRIETELTYPDEENHLHGFNPMVYPDCAFSYAVSLETLGEGLRLTADLKEPVAEKWRKCLRFNLELFPGTLFGKSWIMDEAQGFFPRQPSGPVDRRKSLYRNGILPREGLEKEYAARLMEEGSGYSPLRGDEEVSAPLAAGRRFTLCPEEPLLRLTVESRGAEMELFDGRISHNNGWFVLSCPLTEGGDHDIEWIITPAVDRAWMSPPRIQISQVGYMPGQPKYAVVELDRRDTAERDILLKRIGAEGEETVRREKAPVWGTFLRYRVLRYDFTDVREPGLYRLEYGEAKSSVFRVGADVFDRGVWQPVLEYFLPVQMCHMKVMEKYRVWHGRCHLDDARMAPLCWNHFDGYRQGEDTMTPFAPGDAVPGLSRGGWHDAGDFDLRVESQAGEAYLLAQVWEAFHPEWDSTAIDQEKQTVEIHHPDGRNDLLQQIEHGALAVIGGWEALGRLYRGVIAPTLRQYVMLGDAVNMTENVPGDEDDRWVFTEDNPGRELMVAGNLACVSRALKEFNPDLAARCLKAARELFGITKRTDDRMAVMGRVLAAAELFLTTGEDLYRKALLADRAKIFACPERLGWIGARVCEKLGDEAFTRELRECLTAWKEKERELSAQTPYGVPYKPYIWGAGWEIQRLGVEHYYLCRAFPDLFPPDLTCHALSFILGCHPGESISFASGVGARSATAAYGFNRADYACVPGGVVSGTALIRPDFPELKDWPYLWQQTEYVMGGGSTRFLFLVLAVRELMGRSAE